MGISISGLATEGVGEISKKTSLGDIPESCVALVLTCLDPQEICRFARLNRTFLQASSADVVWESKLPENYQILVKKLFDENPHTSSKKEIYARLSRPCRFHSGTKEVWLEKNTGGICVSISWRGLKITGIDDRRYWNHIPTDESRFRTIAYLQQIWWLEVEGELEFEFPAGTYSLFFRLRLGRSWRRLGRRACSLEQVHGWDVKPVRFQISTSNGQHAISQRYLDELGKWRYHHAGDFVADGSDNSTRIKFSMAQIDCTHTKGGLCLDNVLICPAELGTIFKNRSL